MPIDTLTPEVIAAMVGLAVAMALVALLVVRRRSRRRGTVTVDGMAHRPNEAGTAVRVFHLVDESDQLAS